MSLKSIVAAPLLLLVIVWLMTLQEKDAFVKTAVRSSQSKASATADKDRPCDAPPAISLTHKTKTRKVSFVMYVGVEGTGHHPFQKMAMKIVDVPIRSGEVKNIMGNRFVKGLPHLNKTSGAHRPAPNSSTYDEFRLDRAARALDEVVKNNPDATTFGFADWSNPFSHMILSGVDPIDLYELTQRSVYDMDLRVLVLHRNTTEIIWSTTMGRSFDTVTAKVNEIYTSLITLAAQLKALPVCTWRVFDMTKYKYHPDEYITQLAKFYGKSLSKTRSVVKSVLRDPHAGHTDKLKSSDNETKISKYDTLWEPQDLDFVRDTFDRPAVRPLFDTFENPQHWLLTMFDSEKNGCNHCPTWQIPSQ